MADQNMTQDGMTPKQRYEAKKAERKAQASQPGSYRVDRDEDEMTMLFERFVDAHERIAAALEARNV